ncbi:DNA-processing protein DprA [Thermanaerothrix sp.]|jgi:predicted Rossmann fold nucleotide-binding protein DprA/Smf involved in DNA uptake|uniref:DNA-processing protein DprA n=1 Tax=Thermanaerothrix sp. TaxID=2972675 RepID=UPI002ADD7A2A|nr:DNA-processing protein DprA [Thermanaerothrix sp.]
MTPVSDDSKAILLLCSRLGLPPAPAVVKSKAEGGAPEGEAVLPLTPSEWNALAERLRQHNLRPAHLLRMQDDDLIHLLEGDESSIRRIRVLLERGVGLAFELERLADVGIFPLTRADASYPKRYKERLGKAAPPVLFYAGNIELVEQPGIAVVGSRHADAVAQEAAQRLGEACGYAGLILYSGGAKGVDTLSMQAALDAGGYAVGVLGDSLVRALRTWGRWLRSGHLCLLTPYHPEAGFSVANAMGRNKLIYTLANWAVVVASDKEKGGTWAGAIEALRHRWVPVLVLTYSGMPAGNLALIEKGGLALPYERVLQMKPGALKHYLAEAVNGAQAAPVSASAPAESPLSALPSAAPIPGAPAPKDAEAAERAEAPSPSEPPTERLWAEVQDLRHQVDQLRKEIRDFHAQMAALREEVAALGKAKKRTKGKADSGKGHDETPPPLLKDLP